MDQTKRCPLCGEVILAIAVRCRFCQGDLSQPHPLVSPTAAGAAATQTTGAGAGNGAQRAAEPSAAPTASATANRPAIAGAPVAVPPASDEEFEQRFLEFVYTSDWIINAPSVAYALKVPIDDASERLEDMAARDILIREVDARGSVFFHLPGRNLIRPTAPNNATSPSASYASMSSQSTALVHASHGGQVPGSLAMMGSSGMTPPIDTTLAPSEGTALAALLVNTLCLPGLGSFIGGRSSAGIGQLLLFLIGIPLTLVVVGAPMILSAWIWALITGIDIMNQAKQAQAQRRQQLNPPAL